MSFQNLVQETQIQFPDLQIKYKDESTLMKILSKLMFFNPKFMTSFTTTVGSTVYYPSRSFVKIRPISSAVILLHELIHIYDSKRLTLPLFLFLYTFPQIFVLLAIPLLFISWKLSLLCLLFMAPIPAVFRMYFEKRAYLISLYVLNILGNKMSFEPGLDKQKGSFVEQFKNSDYYFMWPFKTVDKDFDVALVKIRNNEKPFEDPVFIILDKLIDIVIKS